jgi:hypothetical protein
MKKNNCEEIRRELDELMLDEACSASTVEHLKECSACREFYETRTKLRQMVGSLGTVAAPPDFDFRLRARLADGSSSEGFHYWPVARKGLAFAAVLIVFLAGIIVVRNIVNQQTNREVAETKPVIPQPSPKLVAPVAPDAASTSSPLTAGIQVSTPVRNKTERSTVTGPRVKRPLATLEPASTGAQVISGSNAVDVGTTAVIPIDASLPSFKFSLDDGSGNARTISVPTIRFGSQRMLPNGNQFAQKGIW